MSRDLLRSLTPQPDRPASALRVLGDLERRLGRPDEARGLYGSALALYEKQQDGLHVLFLGRDPAQLGADRGQLGAAQLHVGVLAQAIGKVSR